MITPAHIGKYEVERRLGGGGMAEVFLAKVVGAEGFSRRVAIKRVLPGFAEHPSFATLFVSEARLSAQLDHPNVVSVLDFERDPEQGLFLVMELVEGRDLSQLLQTGLLPIPVTLYIITELLRGLGYAHNLPLNVPGVRGLVHRDVSPHNVLLSWEGAIKVSDFGIAKARTASDASASVVIKGKPAYMSPEQANGHALDGRSDLFAVGVMLWEMLVGQSLFHGATVQETLAALFFAPIPSPQQLRADIPHDVAQVALRLLQRATEQRYATAEDAVRDLVACRACPRDGRAELTALLQERFAGQPPVRPMMASASRPIPAPRCAAPSADLAELRRQLGAMTTPRFSGSLEEVPPRSRRWWPLALVLVLGGIAAVGAIALTGRSPTPGGAAPSTPAPATSAVPAPTTAPPPTPAAPAPAVVPAPPAPPPRKHRRSATSPTKPEAGIRDVNLR